MARPEPIAALVGKHVDVQCRGCRATITTRVGFNGLGHYRRPLVDACPHCGEPTAFLVQRHDLFDEAIA